MNFNQERDKHDDKPVVFKRKQNQRSCINVSYLKLCHFMVYKRQCLTIIQNEIIYKSEDRYSNNQHMFQQSLQFSKSYNVGHLYYPSGINCNENNYVRGSYDQIYYVNQQLPTYQYNVIILFQFAYLQNNLKIHSQNQNHPTSVNCSKESFKNNHPDYKIPYYSIIE